MKKKPTEKPSFGLVGSKHGLPSLDDLVKLTKMLTGRDPTPEEIEDARATYEARMPTSKKT